MYEYKIKFTGDMSGVEKDIKTKLGQALNMIKGNSIVIDFDFEYSIKDLQSKLNEIMKTNPSIGIQTKFEVNKKLFDDVKKQLNKIGDSIDVNYYTKQLDILGNRLLQTGNLSTEEFDKLASSIKSLEILNGGNIDLSKLSESAKYAVKEIQDNIGMDTFNISLDKPILEFERLSKTANSIQQEIDAVSISLNKLNPAIGAKFEQNRIKLDQLNEELNEVNASIEKIESTEKSIDISGITDIRKAFILLEEEVQKENSDLNVMFELINHMKDLRINTFYENGNTMGASMMESVDLTNVQDLEDFLNKMVSLGLNKDFLNNKNFAQMFDGFIPNVEKAGESIDELRVRQQKLLEQIAEVELASKNLLKSGFTSGTGGESGTDYKYVSKLEDKLTETRNEADSLRDTIKDLNIQLEHNNKPEVFDFVVDQMLEAREELEVLNQKYYELLGELSTSVSPVVLSKLQEELKETKQSLLDISYYTSTLESYLEDERYNSSNASNKYFSLLGDLEKSQQEVEELTNKIVEMESKIRNNGITGNSLFDSESIKKFIELIEILQQDISAIRQSIGTVDDNDGFNNLITSLKDVNEQLLLMRQNLTEITPKVGQTQVTQQYMTNIQLDDSSRGKQTEAANEKIYEDALKRAMNIYNSIQKAIPEWRSMDDIWGGIASTSNISVDTLKNLYSQEALMSPALSAKQKLEQLINFFKLLNSAIEDRVGNMDDTFDAVSKVKIPTTMLSTDTVRRKVNRNNKTSAQVGLDNDAIENLKKANQKSEEELATLEKIGNALLEIKNILSEISSKNIFLDMLDVDIQKIEEFKNHFQELFTYGFKKESNELGNKFQDYSELRGEIEKVATAIENLSSAFKTEGQIVDGTTADEEGVLDRLVRKIDEIIQKIESKNEKFREEARVVKEAADSESDSLHIIESAILLLTRQVVELTDAFAKISKIDIKLNVDSNQAELNELVTKIKELKESAKQISSKSIAIKIAGIDDSIARSLASIQETLSKGGNTSTLLSDLKELKVQNNLGANLENVATGLKSISESLKALDGVSLDVFDKIGNLAKLENIKDVAVALSASAKKIKDATDAVSKSKSSTSNSSDNDEKLANQIGALSERSRRKADEREKKQIERDAKYQNKALEENYKDRVKIDKDIGKQLEKEQTESDSKQKSKYAKFLQEEKEYQNSLTKNNTNEYLEEQKRKYDELSVTIKRYIDIKKRITEDKFLPGDLEELSKVEETMYKMTDDLENSKYFNKSLENKAYKQLNGFDSEIKDIETKLSKKKQESEYIKDAKELEKLIAERKEYFNLSSKENPSDYENKRIVQIIDNWRKAEEIKRRYAHINLDDSENAKHLRKQLELLNANPTAMSEMANRTLKRSNTYLKNADENRKGEKYNDAYYSKISELKKASEDLEEIQNKVKNLDNLTDEESRKLSEATVKVEKLNQEVKMLPGNVHYILEDTTKINKAIADVSKTMSKNTSMDKSLMSEFDAMQKRLIEIRDTEEQITKADWSVIEGQIAKLNGRLQEAGKTGKSFFDLIMTKARQSSASFISMYFSLYDWIRYIREAATTVRDLNDSLTEMKKVSNESLSTLEQYQKLSFNISDEIGVTGKQLQDSTADWLRLGESLEEAQKSAKTSNILLNVSEFEDINDATTALVSASQAYKDLEKIDIVNVLNNIGNNYSIATNELAEGLQDAAAVLQTQGNDLNEAVSLITAGNAITQDVSKTAGGIRTISLRIAGTEEAKKELQELGEDVEDYVVATSAKKREIIKDYTAVASNNGQGVDILDSNGNLKNTYNILLDISKVYKEIQEEDKKFGTNRAQALVEELAGKNRSNIASSILLNPEILENVKKDAETSQNSAQKELDAYLDSVSGKIAKAQNNLQQLIYNAIDSDLIKDALDLANGFLSTINSIVEKTGALPPILTAVAAGFSAIKNQGRDKKHSLVVNMP